jgi:hypothetical protein
MRGIKVGNLMIFRKSQICLICNIISNNNGEPACIVGIDAQSRIHKGTAQEWSCIIGKSEELRKFGDNILDNILHQREIKAKI